MKPKVSVWAVKLNPNMVELRVANGPVKVRTSKLIRIPDKRYCMDKIILKQSVLIGGRFIGIYRPNSYYDKMGELCLRRAINLDFRKDDVIKLTSEQTKIVLDPTWRKRFL